MQPAPSEEQVRRASGSVGVVGERREQLAHAREAIDRRPREPAEQDRAQPAGDVRGVAGLPRRAGRDRVAQLEEGLAGEGGLAVERLVQRDAEAELIAERPGGLAAQPLGWGLGYGFSWLVIKGFESDLFQIPFVINPPTFAWSSIVVVVAGLASALIVRRRVDHLDLIRVLKTRE